MSGLDLDVFLYWGSLGLAAAAVLLFLWLVASGDEPDVLSKRENRREVAVSDAVYRSTSTPMGDRHTLRGSRI
jgi:hypothetical protein